MNKTLLVMRHAKSSWKEPGLSDFERPLNKRGKQAAPLMANVLSDRQLVPQLILSSAAERARQTTELLLEHWSDPVERLLDQSLYLASPIQYLAMLKRHGQQQDCLMVVGHNPGLEYLVEALTGEDEFMPTAAVAIIEVANSWQSLGQCQLLDVLRPKEIFPPPPN